MSEGLRQDELDVAEASEAEWKTGELALAVGLTLALGGLWYAVSLLPWSCQHLQGAATYAGEESRFVDFVYHQYIGSRSCTLNHLGPGRLAFVAASAVALLYGFTLFLLLRRWWKRGWLAAEVRRVRGAVIALPLVAAGLDIAANITALAGMHVHATPEHGPNTFAMRGWAVRVAPLFAWPKVIALLLALAALAATWFAALGRRWLPRPEASKGTTVLPPPTGGLGICCSGGGIRAASISLGVLSALERNDETGKPLVGEELDGATSILDQASYLASVSGGGYVAGAWRIARGAGDAEPLLDRNVWPAGVIGDPDDYSTGPNVDYDSHTSPGTPSLYRHVQARREFLSTGRGGFPGSLLIAFTFLVINLVVLAAVVVAIAWPSGRVSRTWFVFGGAGCANVQRGTEPSGSVCRRVASHPSSEQRQCVEAVDGSLMLNGVVTKWPDFDKAKNRTRCFLGADGVQMSVRWALIFPPLAMLSLAVVGFLLRLGLWRTAFRRRLSSASAALFGAASYSAFLLLVVPLTLDLVYPFIAHHAGIGSIGAIGALGGVGGVAAQLARKELSRRVVYLGGVLLAAVVGVFSIVVAANAATARGFFALSQPWAYPLLLALLVLVYAGLNPRWWSLHTLYRNRLRGAFAVTRDRSKAPASLRPRQLVEIRDDGTVTLRPEAAQDRLWPLRQDAEPSIDAYRGAPGPVHLVCCSAARTERTATGVKALSFVFAPGEVTLYEPAYDESGLVVRSYAAPSTSYVAALGFEKRAEGTVSAAMAMSGAAFAPAMGRFNLGTTNALLAALNLRLGVWMPNPRYLDDVPKRFPRSRLSHLLKELIGRFSLDDHHLYITDGGHRENLGLVELLRRRCRTIVCVDASGDLPGSFTTLRQAAELARTEAGALLDLSKLPSGPVSALVPGPMPEAPFGVIPVSYDSLEHKELPDARIIHIRPVLYPRLPSALLAYAAEDPMFPHYSTGDQFLTEPQFRRLVQYGKEATNCALRDPDVLDAIADGLGRPTGVLSELGG